MLSKKLLLRRGFATAAANGALSGLRVLDLTRVLAGPFCSMLLGDLGAEIIKVERPGTGDETRTWGPPFLNGESLYFLGVNRNKLSITVNIKSDSGRSIICDLAKRSDVLVENFVPGTMEKLGLGYEHLRAVNPRLVYCSISGFGSDGPRSKQPGYDVSIAAAFGLLSITGPQGGPPCKPGVALTDVCTGLLAKSSIMAALLARHATGVGQKVEVSLMETQLAALVNIAANTLNTLPPIVESARSAAAGTGETGLGAEQEQEPPLKASTCIPAHNDPKTQSEASGKERYEPRPWGTAHESIVPYQAFQCGCSGHILVGAGNDLSFRKLTAAMGLAELADDPMYVTNTL